MNKLKFKVGDRVRIKNLDWYNRHTNGTEIDCGGVPFTSDMKWFCSCVMTISFVHADCYAMVEDLENYYTDEMIEGLVEEETKPKYEDEVNGKYYSTPKYLVRPSGYQFVDENCNVINAMKIVLEKKKKEYPKTYEECCEVLNYKPDFYDEDKILIYGYMSGELRSFQKLLVCRDAYWKLYGEEMGLGKPWEPDWADTEIKYCIANSSIGIKKSNTYDFTRILSFPTEEMRDAFYENFKKEIEICKELL